MTRWGLANYKLTFFIFLFNLFRLTSLVPLKSKISFSERDLAKAEKKTKLRTDRNAKDKSQTLEFSLKEKKQSAGLL